MMQGFDPKFETFPDYILGITHEIWEERQVETLNHYYAPNIIVRSPESLVIGNNTVIEATHQTLTMFPDRELLGEDVIWCGTPEVGMLSSHRIFSSATHAFDGVFGKATGKKLGYRVIADCHAKDNCIDDEWLIRDQGAIVRQLGWLPRDFAEHQLEVETRQGIVKQPFHPDRDQVGVYCGRGNDNSWGTKYADILRALMANDTSVVRDTYDRAVQLFYPGGGEEHGYDGVTQFWQALRASFPEAEFQIDHQIGREDPMLSPRSAIRWSLRGVHSGDGYFGVPTNTEVYIMGISHAEFGPWGIRREYVLFDEVAIWKQILMQQ